MNDAPQPQQMAPDQQAMAEAQMGGQPQQPEQPEGPPAKPQPAQGGQDGNINKLG